MAAEIRSRVTGGVKAETTISPRTKAKFKKFVKKNQTSQAQWLRDQVQGAVKGMR